MGGGCGLIVVAIEYVLYITKKYRKEGYIMAKTTVKVDYVEVFADKFRGTATISRGKTVLLKTEFWASSPERISYQGRDFGESGWSYRPAKENLKKAVLGKIRNIIANGSLPCLCADGPWPAWFRNTEREGAIMSAFEFA